MREAGLDPDEFLADPKHSEALASVIARVLKRANEFYDRACGGIALLPKSCRPAIHASSLLYREIGREVERNFYDSVTKRAVVPKRRKLMLLGKALLLSFSPAGDTLADPAPEARFVVDAVIAAPVPKPYPISFDEKAEWVTNLFLRLDGRKS
jgi:phytoene synthase